jgi:hypothetical protein
MPSLSSLTKSLLNTVSQQSNDAYIIELDEEGRPKGGATDASSVEKAVGAIFPFQYFPESISDTKAVNYAQKEIPGGSLPLYQWVNGGERIISFTAVFTTDVDLLTGSTPGGLTALTAESNITDRLKAQGVARRNVDIRKAVGLLRRYMYPTYRADNRLTPGSQLTVAPPKLRLVLTNSGIGIAGASSASSDSVRVIMTQCDVNWEAYFPSGLPRIATCQLAFAEIAQFGGFIEFPDRDDIAERLLSDTTQGYDFPPRVKALRGD